MEAKHFLALAKLQITNNLVVRHVLAPVPGINSGNGMAYRLDTVLPVMSPVPISNNHPASAQQHYQAKELCVDTATCGGVEESSINKSLEHD